MGNRNTRLTVGADIFIYFVSKCLATTSLVYAMFVQCVVLGIGLWRLTHYPLPVHPISAILEVGVRQSVACSFAALVCGMWAVRRKPTRLYA
jgi:hypothetical protein